MKHAPRQYKRIYLTFYLRIFENDSFLGFLLDISREGMMMMSEFALKENKSYTLKMKVPSSLERKEQKEAGGYIEFTATCKWTKNDDADRDFFLSGFEFTSVSEEAHAIIHRVIEEYRLP